jgi:hypothetical protein
MQTGFLNYLKGDNFKVLSIQLLGFVLIAVAGIVVTQKGFYELQGFSEVNQKASQLL